MYKRYIPQPDGSYRRNRMPDAQRPVPSQAQQPAPPDTREKPQFSPSVGQSYNTGEKPVHRRRKASVPASVGSFLRQLLPGNFDTEDLLVVILLLLMAGDCEEDRSNALLTLALYLFL